MPAEDKQTTKKVSKDTDEEVTEVPGSEWINPVPPDTLGQRLSAAEAEAVVVREEAAKNMVIDETNSSQHNTTENIYEVDSEPEPDPVDLSEDALKAYNELEIQDILTGRWNPETPEMPDLLLHESWAEIPHSYTAPGGLAVGDVVSRQDEDHGFLGVVLEIDTINPNHVLVKVDFGEEGEGYYAAGNLQREGNVFEITERKEKAETLEEDREKAEALRTKIEEAQDKLAELEEPVTTF